MTYRFVVLFLLALPAWSFAQAKATVPDPDPELERKSFIVAEGFEVNLYAADPLLAKPIQMNFDPQGRLWVATSETYPQIKPGQKPNDKVIVLEDTNNDGKADKTTVFADGLLIPTGIEPGDGGVYVANSTELVHFSASKPGQKADKSRVVLSGFGTEDTHHIIHTFRWGFDGNLYFNQSIYIHSHIETPNGVKRLNGGGIWRFRPESMDLDVFVRGFVNTWGHHYDRWGQSLITDGAYGEGVNHGIPGAYFFTAVGSTKIMKGLNPGSPKHCGLEVVSGRHLPDDWQGNVITNDFRGHRVCRFKLGDDGATFTSREMTEVIKTSHGAFRPIDVKMGPDGAIYVADWYNPIIQHGEVDFRDERRDHTHGRIWRITAKGRPLVKKPDLVGAKTADLLDQLKAPEDWTRQQTKRVLKERGAKEVLPALAAWITKLDATDKDYDHHMTEALWLYQGFDVVEPKLLQTMLNAKDYRARAAAVRVLSAWSTRIPNSVELMSLRAVDDEPRVRMEAVRALGATGNLAALEPVMAAMEKPVDRTLNYSLYLTSRDLAPQWLPKFQAGEDVFRGNVKAMAFALQSMVPIDIAKPLLQMVQAGKLPKDREPAAWELIARTATLAEVPAVLEQCAKQPAAFRSVVLSALEENAKQNKLAKPKNAVLLSEQLTSNEAILRQVAARLLGYWKEEGAREAIVRLAGPSTKLPADRAAALEAIASFGDAKATEFLTELTNTPKESVAPDVEHLIRRQAVIALANVNAQTAAAKAVALLTEAKGTDDFTDVFNAFLNRKGGAALLAKALEGRKIHTDIAKAGLRALRSSVQDAKPLNDALMVAGNVAAAKTEVTTEEVQKLVQEVRTTGDPARGELIYRRKDATCLACHAIAGAGGQVGPDMTSIGASAQIDYLVESLLLPNKAVKEGYHATKVTTLSNKVIVGIKTREADGKLYLRTAEDKEVTVALNDIDERAPSRSLMPDGLADILTRQELVDLVRFLSELGKVGPYAPNKARFIRRWQTFEPTPENMEKLRRGRAAVAAETPEAFIWSTNYSKVSGEFPVESFPKLQIWKDAEPITLLRSQLDVTTGGKVLLKINGTTGLAMWIGATPVDLKDETIIDLKPGLQNVTISIDLNKRKEGVRVELEDVAGSPARVNIVNGK
jgi:putative heme-binding domain-containing protein